jgi:hypothetical protein
MVTMLRLEPAMKNFLPLLFLLLVAEVGIAEVHLPPGRYVVKANFNGFRQRRVK